MQYAKHIAAFFKILNSAIIKVFSKGKKEKKKQDKEQGASPSSLTSSFQSCMYLLQQVKHQLMMITQVKGEDEGVHSLGRAGGGRGWSQSVAIWLRVISLRERHPLKAMVSSNSSRSICNTFLTPASPSAANENTTGRPI